jgi:hypothetical protein
MPFIAYVAIVLVSLTGILFELDWLTKPKQDTKAAAPIVASAAVTPRVVAKVDGPNQGPTPLRGKQDTDTAQAAAPAETVGATPASTAAGTAPPISPSPEFGATQTAAAPQTNAQTSQLATQLAVPAASAAPAAATAAPAPAAPPQAAAVPASTPAKPAQAATVQAASVQAPNHCDVAGCSAAYQSFRASDCSYQPMEGPRKFCEKPPQGGQIATTPRTPKVEAAARRPSKDAELRDVERTVRRITTGDELDADPRMGRSEVIVIDRPERGW